MPDKTLTEVFTDIADAIREKTESQETITPLEMAGKIGEISTGYELESDAVYLTNGEGEPTQVYNDTLNQDRCYTYHSDGLLEERYTILVVDDNGSYYNANWGKNWDGSFDYDHVYYFNDSSEINPASLGLGVVINNDEVTVDGIDHTGLYYIAYSNVFEATGLSLNSGTIYTYEGGSTFTPYVPPILDSNKVYMTNGEGEPTEVYDETLSDEEDMNAYYYHDNHLRPLNLRGMHINYQSDSADLPNYTGDRVYYIGSSTSGGVYQVEPLSSGFKYVTEDNYWDLESDSLYFTGFDSQVEGPQPITLNSGSIYTYEGGSTFTPYVPPVVPEVPDHSGMFWYEKDGDPAFSEQSVTDEKYYQYRDGTGLVSLNPGIYVSDSNGNTFNLPSDIDYNNGYLVHFNNYDNEWNVETLDTETNYINRDGKTLLFDSSFDPDSHSNLLYDAGCGFNSEWLGGDDEILLFFSSGTKWAMSGQNLPNSVGDSENWIFDNKTYKITRID